MNTSLVPAISPDSKYPYTAVVVLPPSVKTIHIVVQTYGMKLQHTATVSRGVGEAGIVTSRYAVPLQVSAHLKQKEVVRGGRRRRRRRRVGVERRGM